MPPSRQPGHSPGPQLTPASALRPRRCSAGDSDRGSPASLRSRSRGAASSSLPVPFPPPPVPPLEPGPANQHLLLEITEN